MPLRVALVDADSNPIVGHGPDGTTVDVDVFRVDSNGLINGSTSILLTPNVADDPNDAIRPADSCYLISFGDDLSLLIQKNDVDGQTVEDALVGDGPLSTRSPLRIGQLSGVDDTDGDVGDALVKVGEDSLGRNLYELATIEGGGGDTTVVEYTATAREVAYYEALSSALIIPIIPGLHEVNNGTITRFPSGGTWGIPAVTPFIPDNTVFDLRDVDLVAVNNDGSEFAYTLKLTPSVSENRQGVWLVGGFFGIDPAFYDVEDEPWASWHDSCAVSVQTADFVHVGGWLYNVGDGWAFSAASGETAENRTGTNWALIGCAADGPKDSANDRQAYVHDDAVENDSYASGLVDDGLFNGVFCFYSAVAGSARDGRTNTVTFRDNLVRLAPYDNSFKAYAGTPIYGPDQHSNFFKMQTWTPGSTGYPPNMRFEGRHIFYADQDEGYSSQHGLDLPATMAGQTITVDPDAEIILIWGGGDDWPALANWEAACAASGATLTVHDNIPQEEARALWNGFAEDWRGKHQVLKVGRELATIADESITHVKLADDSLRERHFGNNCIVEDAIYPNTISKDSLALNLFNNYVHGRGTLASRPTASAANAGWYYTATDVNDGTTYRSSGSTWHQIAPGVSEASAALTAHAAAADPHPGYLTATEGAAAFDAAGTASSAVSAHTGDTSAAHAASAIAFTPNGSISADNVQDAIQEVRDEAGGATPDASETTKGIVELATTSEATTGTDTVRATTPAGVKAVMDAHTGDSSDAHDASAISFNPNGSISATDVQAAIEEVRDEAGSVDTTAVTVGSILAVGGVVDQFARADTTGPLGDADYGNRTWETIFGSSAGIQSGAAYNPSGSYSLNVLEGESGAGVLRATVSNAGGEFWLVMRAVDSNNYYRFGRTAGSSTYTLQLIVAGSFGTMSTTGPGGTAANGDEVEIRVGGNDGINCYVNGTWIYGVGDVQVLGYKVGFAFNGTTARIADLSWTPASFIGDPLGTADTLLDAHTAASDPHPDYLKAAELPTASTSAQGIVELATTGEATTGTDTDRAVTPAGAKAVMDDHLAASDPHPDYLKSAELPTASTSAQGIVELATTGETTTGTDTARATTPAGVQAAIDQHAGDDDPHSDRSYARGLVGSLGGVTNAAAARANLDLGDSAQLDVGDTAGTVAAGDDPRIPTDDWSDTSDVWTASGWEATTDFNSILGDDPAGGWDTVQERLEALSATGGFNVREFAKLIGATVPKNDAVEITGASITSGSNALSWSGATTAMQLAVAAGNTLTVVLAGAGASNANLVTTVTAVTVGGGSPGLTLANNAGTTRGSGTCYGIVGTNNSPGFATIAAAAQAVSAKLLYQGGGYLFHGTAWSAASANAAPLMIKGAGWGTTKFWRTHQTEAVFTGGGTYGTVDVDLSGAHDAGDGVITLTSVTGLVVGDYLTLCDDTQPIPGEEPSAAALRGETVRIKSISGSDLTLEGPLENDYADATRVRSLRPMRGLWVEGIEFDNPVQYTGGAAARWFNLPYHREHTFKDCRFKRTDVDSIRINGQAGLFENLRFIDHSSARDTHLDGTTTLGYTINLAHTSSDNIIRNVFAEGCRHAFTTSSNSAEIPPRHNKVIDSFSWFCEESGFDTHPTAEHQEFIGCTAVSGDLENAIGSGSSVGIAGFQVRGSNTKIVNCTAIGFDFGIRIDQGANDCLIDNPDVSGCRIGVLIAGGNNCRIVDGEIEAYDADVWVTYDDDYGAGTVDAFSIERTLLKGDPSVAALDFASDHGEYTGVWDNDFHIDCRFADTVTTKAAGWSAHTLASGAALAIPTQSNVYRLTGTTGTTLAAPSLANYGDIVTIQGPATGLVTVTADADLALNTPTFVMNQYCQLTLMCNGTQWVEISRTPTLDPRMFKGPTGTLWQTPQPRGGFSENERGAQVSGTIYWWTEEFRRGLPLSAVSLNARNTAGASMTHSWIGVANLSTKVVLAISNDDTTAAWGQNAARTFTFTNRWDPDVSGDYRVFMCLVGTTIPTHIGVTNAGTSISQRTPQLTGTCDTGQTTPPSVGATLGTDASSNTGYPYLWWT